jgi:hypothetical protein
MLAHSPPPPLALAVDYKFRDDIGAEDEEGAMVLALKRFDRVRIEIPVTSVRKLVVAMDEKYPILEYLIIMPLFAGQDKVT